VHDREPLDVDPHYPVRDNQFWYARSQLAPLVRGKQSIVVRIHGLGVRTLRHAAPGRDGRMTTSFTFSTRQDREWWGRMRGSSVRIELLQVDGEADFPRAASVQVASPSRATTSATVQEASTPNSRTDLLGPVLCVGLDVAWFGGSARNPDSQHDLLTSVRFDQGPRRALRAPPGDHGRQGDGRLHEPAHLHRAVPGADRAASIITSRAGKNLPSALGTPATRSRSSLCGTCG
jgi:hypothetical protein